jgi:hypothetical protein
MKHIFFFLLLGTLTIQAQTILEKDLLGKWNISYIEAMGCHIDIKTRQVTLSAELQQKVKETGKDAAEIKQALNDMVDGLGVGDIKVAFKPGSIIEWEEGGQTSRSGYLIYVDKEKTILLSEDMHTQFGVAFKGKYLELSDEKTDAGLLIMGLEKI